jgi:hypothetical protein
MSIAVGEIVSLSLTFAFLSLAFFVLHKMQKIPSQAILPAIKGFLRIRKSKGRGKGKAATEAEQSMGTNSKEQLMAESVLNNPGTAMVYPSPKNAAGGLKWFHRRKTDGEAGCVC